jgi:mannose-6-phosphate isomerase-like protein (cupin superfamily)
MQVVAKPWGQEEILEVNEKYMLKKLTMWGSHRCSLQYHNIKRETIYLLSGKLNIFHGCSQEQLVCLELTPGESFTLPPGIIHRMVAVEDSVYLEASTPELDDVIRVSDDYGRKQDGCL